MITINFNRLFFIIFSINALASDTSEINQKLREFDLHPKSFMKNPANVEKFDPVTRLPAILPARSLDLNERDRVRQSIIKSSQGDISIKAPIYTNDDPENLVDQYTLSNLQDIENANLMEAQLKNYPWSDDYWPFYSGTLAKRYADPYFPNSKDWSANTNYILSTTQIVDLLSPAEKYDLLIGNRNRTFTSAMIQDGRTYYDTHGSVETWMGICSGWAPASFSLDRPSKTITLLAADRQTSIRFYPSDIKALASLLWDRAKTQTRLIGGRCNESNPPEDSNGRIVSNTCFNTNPGAWHLSLVNQIGVSQRSLIMDTTYDYQVWNQPIYAYSYSYFNPQTRTAVSNLQAATVKRSAFSNDYFSAYRSRDTRFVVGITMLVSYVAETQPSHNFTDSVAQDRHLAVRYFYDLELDADGNIIGGEWYQRQHPDFLWTTVKGTHARSPGDILLDNARETTQWDGRGAVPQAWLAAAQSASRYGQPLARIVESLVAHSRE